MKRVIAILLLSTPVFILIFCTGSVSADHKKKSDIAANKTPVVLELFTSQGCSSCPPADRLLGSYAGRDNVFPLSFHVDYWNRLGWKDPFSDHAYADRQNIYAAAFGSGDIYTPQLIINGQKEMVGSDEDKIADAIKQFQSEAVSSKIIIDGVTTDGNTISVAYSLQNRPANSVMNIALVQNKAVTSIKAGENNGVTLTDYNVVRSFKTIPANAEKDRITVDLLEGIDKKELSLILFLQDVGSHRIYTAIRSGL